VKTIKTITKDSKYWKRIPEGTYLRMRDEDAVNVVNNNQGSYAPKSEWKKLRDQETTNKEASNAKN
jgi:hypothetical protein